MNFVFNIYKQVLLNKKCVFNSFFLLFQIETQPRSYNKWSCPPPATHHYRVQKTRLAVAASARSTATARARPSRARSRWTAGARRWPKRWTPRSTSASGSSPMSVAATSTRTCASSSRRRASSNTIRRHSRASFASIARSCCANLTPRLVLATSLPIFHTWIMFRVGRGLFGVFLSLRSLRWHFIMEFSLNGFGKIPNSIICCFKVEKKITESFYKNDFLLFTWYYFK